MLNYLSKWMPKLYTSRLFTKMLSLFKRIVRFVGYNYFSSLIEYKNDRMRDIGEFNMKMFYKNLILVFLSVALLISCASPRDLDEEKALEEKFHQREPEQDKLYIDADPQSTEVTITLYYKHEVADFLVPEIREVHKDKQSLEQLVVEEYLKGPKDFEKLMIMPPDVQVLDVTRKTDTIFVNLNEAFKEDIDLNTIPGKQNISEEDMDAELMKMKRLSVYSIVNSLTDIEGGLEVKFLVENRQPTYEDIGAQEIARDIGIESTTPMAAIGRDKDFILSPSRSVEYVLKAMTGTPNYDIVYKFLASKTSDGEDIPSIEEFKRTMDAADISLETDDDPIDEEEIKSDGNTAYVKAHFIVKHGDGKKEEIEDEVFTVTRENGIWKLILPSLFDRLGR